MADLVFAHGRIALREYNLAGNLSKACKLAKNLYCPQVKSHECLFIFFGQKKIQFQIQSFAKLL